MLVGLVRVFVVMLLTWVVVAGCGREPVEDLTVHAVPVDGDPSRGPADAPVTIVIASEFACPHCVEASATIQRIERELPGKIRVVWKDLIVHRDLATVPALAACAADRQGKFWEMEQAIFQDAWTAPPQPKLRNADALSQDAMLTIAETVGLDLDRFVADMLGEACRKGVDEDRRVLLELGAKGTPTFYVNGRHVAGIESYGAFKKIVEQELAKK